MIKYIGFYDKLNSKNQRNCSLAAVNKMDYICSALNQIGYRVQLVSPSWFVENTAQKAAESNEKINENTTIIYSPSYATSNRITSHLKTWFSRAWLFCFLLKNTKKGETIIVYHSLMLMIPVLLAKKIKKFKLLLETEEIYQDIVKCSYFTKKLEYKTFEKADAYIFPTELLNEKLNVNNKPYSLIYGTYQVEKERNIKFNDGKIHAVYAGTFEPRKGGAITAVKTAKYLDENYHIHIIGFGSEKDKLDLLNLIDNISNKTRCEVTFDGCLTGEEYIEFLQKCDIGLSTQIPNAEYNNTSFPSKILSYLANGLRVVSIRIPVLEKSEISNILFYYDTNDPQKIADKINNINLCLPYDSKSEICKLSDKFKMNIKGMLDFLSNS